MQGDREKIMKSGFNGYLSKPIDARSLAEQLERLLRKREDRSAPPNQSNQNQADGKARTADSGK
jgi:DNA-binding response OmpR family regulator